MIRCDGIPIKTRGQGGFDVRLSSNQGERRPRQGRRWPPARLRRSAPCAHVPGLRALGRLDARELWPVRLRLARGARPHRRGPRLGHGHWHRRIRLVGVRPCCREHPHLLRRPHVHAPRCLPLCVQHAQAHHGPPHARESRLLRHACERRASPRRGRLRCRDRGASRP